MKNQQFNRQWYFFLLWPVLLGFLVTVGIRCAGEDSVKDESSIVLARVGDKVITVDEFRKNYELGFPHLKIGKDRKRSYLNWMINELILAQEGYRLGLDQSERVQLSVERMKRELLVEALIREKIQKNISVTMDEIKEAINKSKVSFKFRFWVESSYARAVEVANEMKQRGYADVVGDLIRAHPEISPDPALLETGYLTWMDVTPEVLNAIKDLPYGDISEPVLINGKYYIFQVLDIRRMAVTENEYYSKAPSVKKALLQQKLHQAVATYTTNLLEEKNIVTKKPLFDKLYDALEEWKAKRESLSSNFKKAVLSADESLPKLSALRSSLNEPMVTSTDGDISLNEFLDYFFPEKIPAEVKNKQSLRIELHKLVALTIRDYFLLKEARKDHLEELPEVTYQLNLWKDKWVYEEMRHQLLNNLTEKNRTKLTYLDTALDSSLSTFRERYPIEINEAVLDTIQVVDFQKSRWAAVQLFRTGTNHLAYPIADPLWTAPGNSFPAQKAQTNHSPAK